MAYLSPVGLGAWGERLAAAGVKDPRGPLRWAEALARGEEAAGCDDSALRQAGWARSKDGSLRRLYDPTAYRLLWTTDRARIVASPVVAFMPEVADLMDDPPDQLPLVSVDLADPCAQTLGLGGGRLVVPIDVRRPWDLAYAEFDLRGRVRRKGLLSRWRTLEPHLDRMKHPESRGAFVLGPRRCTPFESVYDMRYTGRSQFGGAPGWEQGADYPDCTVCDRPMVSLAEVHCSDGPGGDSVFYAFTCVDCRMSATLYQET